jgi:hypothetical protein
MLRKTLPSRLTSCQRIVAVCMEHQVIRNTRSSARNGVLQVVDLEDHCRLTESAGLRH